MYTKGGVKYKVFTPQLFVENRVYRLFQLKWVYITVISAAPAPRRKLRLPDHASRGRIALRAIAGARVRRDDVPVLAPSVRRGKSLAICPAFETFSTNPGIIQAPCTRRLS
jgi:hypothetical protein